MKYYDIYVSLIILVKVIFVILAIVHLSYKVKKQTNNPTDKKVLYWKDRMEFIFTIMMALLLIVVFNPRTSKVIGLDTETKLLLFLFGIILIITAKWEIFFKESVLLKKVQFAV
jgi:hypothetical protein